MGFSTGGNTLPVFLILSNFYMNWVTALDIITVSRLMKDPETVTSNDGAFKLGFFSPGNTSNRYVGIWYLSESNVIWVANRGQPLEDSSGVVSCHHIRRQKPCSTQWKKTSDGFVIKYLKH